MNYVFLHCLKCICQNIVCSSLVEEIKNIIVSSKVKLNFEEFRFKPQTAFPANYDFVPSKIKVASHLWACVQKVAFFLFNMLKIVRNSYSKAKDMTLPAIFNSYFILKVEKLKCLKNLIF